VQVYFCDPQSPWQRGSHENTNLLLRQYFPRGADLAPVTQAQLDQVSLRLNQRPRKTFAPISRLYSQSEKWRLVPTSAITSFIRGHGEGFVFGTTELVTRAFSA